MKQELSKKKLQFLDLYCMVLADGIIHPKEMETLYRIGLENYSLTEDEITESVNPYCNCVTSTPLNNL